MATSKAKRPVLLAQPKPQPAKYALAGGPGPQRRSPNPEPVELMPVKAHAYRAIAELNGGFEKVLQELQTLARVSYLSSDSIIAMHNLICRIRAQANREFTAAVLDRETMNAGHFEQLCAAPENAQATVAR